MDLMHSQDMYAESREQRCHNHYKILANIVRICKSEIKVQHKVKCEK